MAWAIAAFTTTRPFGLWTATALVVGGMIGSGIFLLPASLAPYGWISVVAWIVSTAGALAIGFVMIRLAAALPYLDGAIPLVAHALGPVAGVLVGWTYWVATWCTNAAIAVAATSYLSAIVPRLSATPLTGAVVAIALIWVLTLLNLAGARAAGRFQVVTTVLKLLPLAAVVAVAAYALASGQAALAPLPAMPMPAHGLTSAIALTLFALLGFECAGICAARVHDAPVNVARATYYGTAVTGVFYILVCSAIVLILPVAIVQQSGAPLGTFIETFWGKGMGAIVTLFAAIAAIGALNGWILMQGEVPRAMAANGLLPAWFARTSTRGTPDGVLILSSILATLLVVSNAARSLGGIFEFMVLLTTAANLWFYASVCVAALKMRVAVPVALLGLAFTIWAMIGAGIAASLLSLVLMLTALPLHVVAVLRRRNLLAH